MYEVVFTSGPRSATAVPVTGSCRLGRNPENDVEIPDLNASRHHATLTWDGTVLRLIDNHSSNHTYVNGKQITEMILKANDVIQIGETRLRVQRRAHLSAGAAGAGPSGTSSSSMFSFRDDGDLGNSLSLSLPGSAAVAAGKDLEVLQSRLNTIYTVADGLARTTSVDELVGLALNTVFQVFSQAERCFLMLGDSVEHLHARAMRQRSGEPITDMAISRSLCREALRRRQILTWREGGNTEFDQGMSIVQLNIRNALIAPLIVREEVLGLLLIYTSDRARAFSEADAQMAAGVCHQISIALKGAQLIEQVKEAEQRRANLLRYLPPQLADQAVHGILEMGLGGRACWGTILFADVISFTRIAEKLSPEEVVGLMNRFFNRMVPCITGEKGGIDKFMGDSIMANWGIPFKDADASTRAGRAGLGLQNSLAGLVSMLVAEGKPPLRMGVGMETGSMVAGNVGSEDRREYTVLGDIVNTSSRIQGATCASQVLMGNTAWREVAAEAVGVKMPPLTVKNKSEPVQTYSLRGLKAELGDEYLLHVPVQCAERRCYIIRRLGDGSFIMLHPDGLAMERQVLTLALAECEPVPLGPTRVIKEYPNSPDDGLLLRSQVVLGDMTLGGLFDRRLLDCPKSWERMQRSQA